MSKKAICVLLCLIMACLCLPYAVGETALGVTYAVPNGRSESVLLDHDVMTRITVKQNANITLTLSRAGAGRTAYIEWFSIPKDAELIQYDASNKAIGSTRFQLPDAYACAVSLDEQCAKLTLRAQKAEYSISTLFVAEGEPDASYEWMQPTESCDMLFIAPTPANAMETFGSVLAQYGVAHGVTVGVVCMTVDHRYCAQELEHALLSMGIQNAPIYLGCEDENYLLESEIRKRWSASKPEDKLQALIQTLQPKVVISVDEQNGDLRAAETVSIVRRVMQNTKVPKFYIATDKGSTVVDCTKRCMELGDLCAYETASHAYWTMQSRGIYRKKLSQNPAFHLELQTVGADRDGNDLLENIDKLTLIRYTELATPEPLPTDTPTTAPTETPAVVAEVSTPAIVSGIYEEEIELPTEAPTPAPTATPKRGLFSCGGVEETPVVEATPVVTEVPTAAPTEAPTPEPTEVPTPEPTEVPTPEPTPDPTPVPVLAPSFEPTNFDEHFINDGGEEFVSFDNENGEWIYRSDILAVEITRVSTTITHGRSADPVVYFVAHIYERGYDSFRPTFGSWKHNGVDLKGAREMATEAKAVLWITGDNLINQDVDKKGTLIRDGYLFQRRTNYDSFWLDPDTLEMKIVHKNEIKADELLESGVENCFSFGCGFGPVAIENGRITKASASTTSQNPRTLLGMIEPGHFVAMVADGRQPGYSLGLTGTECAEIMHSLGCQTAYNLDGGISATMVFMGNKINRHGTERYNGLASGARTMPDGLTWGYSELCGTYTNLQEDNG